MKIKRYNAKDIVGVHPIDYFEDEDGEVVMYEDIKHLVE